MLTVIYSSHAFALPRTTRISRSSIFSIDRLSTAFAKNPNLPLRPLLKASQDFISETQEVGLLSRFSCFIQISSWDIDNSNSAWDTRTFDTTTLSTFIALSLSLIASILSALSEKSQTSASFLSAIYPPRKFFLREFTFQQWRSRMCFSSSSLSSFRHKFRQRQIILLQELISWVTSLFGR
jgi:hypothetical protein